MEKINIYETDKERERRETNLKIKREYLDRSAVILSGEVTPNRVISFLATKYGRSVMGIKHVLKQAGIYQDAKHPVIMPSPPPQPQQMSLF